MNKWTDGKNVVVSETCPSEDWYPVINFKRVHGSTYEPYKKGSAQWLKEANRDLSNRARSNFEIGRR